MNTRRAIFLAGPTASGKSDVALLLAEQLGGEIISVDSMQVYRGLDIGTAKPSASEIARVRHHLVDVAGLTEAFDAARFVQLAAIAEKDILSRGKTPVFCGGTGFYFKAYIHGLGEAPPSNATLRAELQKMPMEQLLAELERTDEVAYEKIDRQNPRRVIRAIEVIRLTGKPFSQQRSDWQEIPESGHAISRARLICLKRDPGDLHRRIESRVAQMFARGLVEETRQLLAGGLEQNQTAMQSIGYRQVVEHLRGARGLAETIELVNIRTRQFAKRQLTWFRRQLPTDWVHCEKEATAPAIVEKCLKIIREV